MKFSFKELYEYEDLPCKQCIFIRRCSSEDPCYECINYNIDDLWSWFQLPPIPYTEI